MSNAKTDNHSTTLSNQSKITENRLFSLLKCLIQVMSAGGKFISLHCFSSLSPRTFQNYMTEVLAFAWKTE